jgi:hypothetical protein
LGAYSIPSETGLLIPSVTNSNPKMQKHLRPAACLELRCLSGASTNSSAVFAAFHSYDPDPFGNVHCIFELPISLRMGSQGIIRDGNIVCCNGMYFYFCRLLALTRLRLGSSRLSLFEGTSSAWKHTADNRHHHDCNSPTSRLSLPIFHSHRRILVFRLLAISEICRTLVVVKSRYHSKFPMGYLWPGGVGEKLRSIESERSAYNSRNRTKCRSFRHLQT